MAIFTMDSGRTTRLMVSGYTSMSMELCTKAYGGMIFSMVRARNPGQIVLNTKETMHSGGSTESVHIDGPMAHNTQVSGKKIKSMVSAYTHG